MTWQYVEHVDLDPWLRTAEALSERRLRQVEAVRSGESRTIPTVMPDSTGMYWPGDMLLTGWSRQQQAARTT